MSRHTLSPNGHASREMVLLGELVIVQVLIYGSCNGSCTGSCDARHTGGVVLAMAAAIVVTLAIVAVCWVIMAVVVTTKAIVIAIRIVIY